MSAETATPKKTKTPTKVKAKASHPTSAVMVKAAITELKERNGSSIQAIKKYIAAHYKVDIVKMSPFIRKALKAAVEKGVLTQTKGKGASGSFKLMKEKAAPAPKKTTAKKPAVKKAKSPKKTSVKKATKAKTPKKAIKKTTTKAKSPKKVTKKPAAKKVVAKKTTKKTTSKKA
ncbi:histone H1 [Lepeophtheirus salmonis]|uniref:histone H1 n=1 Tax=Lepeophtheirus salmonis TaxID=72036 RepID=UPI001AE3732D|nr:histone H1A, sperm-like [Lepeophtheirus salmonis]